MNSYRNAEIEYRERCKARIQRQLEISEKNTKYFIIVLCRLYFLINVVCFCIYVVFVF
jgi:hypothetical protein